MSRRTLWYRASPSRALRDVSTGRGVLLLLRSLSRRCFASVIPNPVLQQRSGTNTPIPRVFFPPQPLRGAPPALPPGGPFFPLPLFSAFSAPARPASSPFRAPSHCVSSPACVRAPRTGPHGRAHQPRRAHRGRMVSRARRWHAIRARTSITHNVAISTLYHLHSLSIL